jgi:hypothetical protein
LSPPPISTNSRLRGFGFVLAVVAWGLLSAGCEVFHKSKDVATTTARKLPNLQAPPGSIQLDIVYVERPVGDPLLGSQLWRHVDEVGKIDASARQCLRKSGMRVGIVGANPPVALQQMLGLKSDFAYEPGAEEAKQLVGRSFFLLSGGATDVQVSPAYSECSVNIDAEESSELFRFENAVCKFRMRTTRLQEGWIRLEFIPQIHHGDDKLRYAVGATDWKLQNGKQTETYYLQRFEIELATGEMAILTADEGAAGTLGQLFFRGPSGLRRPKGEDDLESAPPESPCPIQRLFVIRLAGMDEAQPVSSRSR